MIRYEVEFSPRSMAQLEAQRLYIETGPTQSAALANKFAVDLISHCKESLGGLPYQGQIRDDIRAGIRTTHYKGSTVIAFKVDDELQMVFIDGLFFGGQDYETELRDE